MSESWTKLLSANALLLDRFIVKGFPIAVVCYVIWGLFHGNRGFYIWLLIPVALYTMFFLYVGYGWGLKKIRTTPTLLVLGMLMVCAAVFLWQILVIETGDNTTVFWLALGFVSVLILPFALVAGYWHLPYNWTFIRKHRYACVLPMLCILTLMFHVVFFIAAGATLIWLISGLPEKPSVTKHRPDLLVSPEAIRQVKALLNHATSGILCGEVTAAPLHASVQDRAVVIGPPGTGKTVFLISQLLEWAKTRRPFVCLDVKPEIQDITKSQLEQLGYRVIAFNPSSKTGEHYNLLDDLDSPESIGELASALIPSGEEENAVFNESARDFLDAIITHLKTEGQPTLPQIWDFISEAESYQEMLQVLSGSKDPDARSLANALSNVSTNERLMGSIYATFKANLRFLRYPNIRETLTKSDFSLAELTGKRPTALFLQFEEENAQITGKLFSVMIGHLIRYLISNTNRPPVLLLLDEIGNVPPVAGLVQKLNTIRSRHIPTWMYWQSVEQMQRYGSKPDEGPNTILAACDFQMVFRLNDNATAEWMSKRIGTVDRLVENVTVTYGDSDVPNETRSQQLVTEPIVFPHQLQQLGNGEVICTYRGAAWRGYAKPYFKD